MRPTTNLDQAAQRVFDESVICTVGVGLQVTAINSTRCTDGLTIHVIAARRSVADRAITAATGGDTE